MTKLNLNPLINYFSDKDPKIASQLSRLAQAESSKELKSSVKTQMSKIAETLVEIADSLETTDPELAQEADDILATITAQMMEIGPAGGPPQDGPGIMPPLLIDEEEEDLPLDEEEDDVEYDEVPVDEFKNMAEGLPLRLTDRSRKERWLSAYEDAALGLKYMQKGREKIERAHKILDEAGDRIRFKTDFKW